MIIQNISDIPCMILCGGKGTRLRDVTELLPKPMVQIGEFPIVLHIMKWYAKFGVKKFILCLGFKKECFISYFTNFINNTSDIKIDLGQNTITHYQNDRLDWEIVLADTGLDSKTSDRVKIASKYLMNDRFFLTYGDGVADIDISKLYSEHLNSHKSITISKVKSPARFGLMETSQDGTVLDFKEKTCSDGYINGGFMVLEKKFIENYLSRHVDVFFEAEPLTEAVKNRDVHAYEHNGFWQCMDNLKDYEMLNNIWKNGNAKWMV